MRRIWSATLRRIERDLARLERDRDELDRVIARLRQTAVWLRRQSTSTKTPSSQSLTSACRAALRAGPQGLTPLEVRDLLTTSGFEWTGFTNPMSAVHTVLKRLVKQDEASSRVSDDGRKRFVWKRQAWPSASPAQVAESSRIEHLLDGAVSDEDFARMLDRWRRLPSR